MARTENLTIMFTDVVGYTQLTSIQSRAENKSMLRRCNRVLLPLVNRFGGWHIKSIGDALLIGFRSPTDAVHCGMALHDALAESNRGLPQGQHLHIRVAINVGEVLVESNDVFGEAVNVASRVENITPPDAIYFTEAVYLAMNKAEVPSKLIGTENLKGIPEPVKIYMVPPHHVNRLVPAAEELGKSAEELPYGGMHKAAVEISPYTRLKNRLLEAQFSAAQAVERLSSPGRRWLAQIRGTGYAARWLLAGTGLLIVAAAVTAFYVSRKPAPLATATGQTTAPVQEPVHALLRRADPLLAGDGDYTAVQALYEPRLAQNPQDAEALLLKGHVLFAQSNRQGALAAYEQALSIDPSLREEDLLAKNLVNGLSWASAQAIPLLSQHMTPAMADLLAQRTAQPGAQGRRRAVRLLEKAGLARRVDRFGLAIQDLREASNCEDRLDAVRRLRQLRDRRALPELQAQMGGGLQGWWRNRCLRDETQAAINEIAPH